MNYFQAEQVNHHITCIRSHSGELMYFLQGSKHAILMDTCLGIKGLRSYVDALANQPYDVIITHGHIDHAMGAQEFMDDHKIYMNLKDMDLYHSMEDVEGRLMYAKLNGGMTLDLSEDDFMPPTEVPFIDLSDGMVFDLGGLTVEILAVPGHTQGSMALLIPEEKTLILGDAGNGFTFLFDEKNSSTVQEYQKMLIGLKKRIAGKVDKIYMCHHRMEAPVTLLDELIEVCNDIIARNVWDGPFEFMGEKGIVIAKEMVFDQSGPHRKDGKLANIVYRPGRI
ncbi:MAG: MBL fold metallo-hydrolase [Lachnospiraceae bacterium]|nr:MBL fold metallo-hydrolase [Lachnospiraceae bacterium]